MIKECFIYEEQFAELLEGGLSWGERISMQRHVEECAYCRQELLAMKRHWDAVELMSVVPAKIWSKSNKEYSFDFKAMVRRMMKLIWPRA